MVNIPSLSSPLRDKLDLLHRILDDEDPNRLWNTAEVNEGAIPASILAQHQIQLVHHLFELPSKANVPDSLTHGLEPPFLFHFQDPAIFSRYPIKPDPGDKTEFGLQRLRQIGQSGENVFKHTENVARHLISWTIGGYPRALPFGVMDLGELCNIAPVMFPHGLAPEDRSFYHISWPPSIDWITDLHEYITLTPDNRTLYPHLILVNHTSQSAKDDTITRAELVVIVAAMRNRSRQPAEFNEEVAWEEENNLEYSPPEPHPNIPLSEEDLMFPREKRFPVNKVPSLN